jgi:hypothetical protein
MYANNVHELIIERAAVIELARGPPANPTLAYNQSALRRALMVG